MRPLTEEEELAVAQRLDEAGAPWYCLAKPPHQISLGIQTLIEGSFWRIRRSPDIQEGRDPAVLELWWGRDGGRGRRQVVVCETYGAMRSQMNSRVARQEARGYRAVLNGSADVGRNSRNIEWMKDFWDLVPWGGLLGGFWIGRPWLQDLRSALIPFEALRTVRPMSVRPEAVTETADLEAVQPPSQRASGATRVISNATVRFSDPPLTAPLDPVPVSILSSVKFSEHRMTRVQLLCPSDMLTREQIEGCLSASLRARDGSEQRGFVTDRNLRAVRRPTGRYFHITGYLDGLFDDLAAEPWIDCGLLVTMEGRRIDIGLLLGDASISPTGAVSAGLASGIGSARLDEALREAQELNAAAKSIFGLVHGGMCRDCGQRSLHETTTDPPLIAGQRTFLCEFFACGSEWVMYENSSVERIGPRSPRAEEARFSPMNRSRFVVRKPS